jgi:hypothetical protein
MVLVAVLVTVIALYLLVQLVTGIDVVRLGEAQRIAKATRPAPSAEPSRRDSGAVDIDEILGYQAPRRDSTKRALMPPLEWRLHA